MYSRRCFLQSSSILLSCFVGGKTLLLTPAEAQAAGIALQVLTEAEADTLAALAEAMVPGARTAGIVHYLDKQCAASTQDCLLMVRYLGVAAPYLDFYRAALTAANQAAIATHGTALSALSQPQAAQLVGEISQGNPAFWDGPPAAFFYFVLRADAIDVVYGTKAGFAKLDIPYSAHIAPTQDW